MAIRKVISQGGSTRPGSPHHPGGSGGPRSLDPPYETEPKNGTSARPPGSGRAHEDERGPVIRGSPLRLLPRPPLRVPQGGGVVGPVSAPVLALLGEEAGVDADQARRRLVVHQPVAGD